MTRPMALSHRVGEVMAPGTLVTALLMSPSGEVKLDPGVLHGRSELEESLTMMAKRDLVGDGQTWQVVWVAIELDQAGTPVRYKGLSVAEILVNASKRVGYKSLAEHVNRMSEAMRGGVNVAKLTVQVRPIVARQLMSIGAEWWDHATDALKQALTS